MKPVLAPTITIIRLARGRNKRGKGTDMSIIEGHPRLIGSGGKDSLGLPSNLIWWIIAGW
jgi:hypothetical protein